MKIDWKIEIEIDNWNKKNKKKNERERKNERKKQKRKWKKQKRKRTKQNKKKKQTNKKKKERKGQTYKYKHTNKQIQCMLNPELTLEDPALGLRWVHPWHWQPVSPQPLVLSESPAPTQPCPDGKTSGKYINLYKEWRNIHISSVESQKGAIPIQRCSVENQKGAIAIDTVQW